MVSVRFSGIWDRRLKDCPNLLGKPKLALG